MIYKLDLFGIKAFKDPEIVFNFVHSSQVSDCRIPL